MVGRGGDGNGHLLLRKHPNNKRILSFLHTNTPPHPCDLCVARLLLLTRKGAEGKIWRIRTSSAGSMNPSAEIAFISISKRSQRTGLDIGTSCEYSVGYTSRTLCIKESHTTWAELSEINCSGVAPSTRPMDQRQAGGGARHAASM